MVPAVKRGNRIPLQLPRVFYIAYFDQSIGLISEWISCSDFTGQSECVFT